VAKGGAILGAYSTDPFLLEHTTYKLTQRARQGKFAPLKGYEAVISRIFDVLLCKGKSKLHYNPLLLHGDETLRLQVILEVVRHLAIGEAPDSLSSVQVLAPNLAALCSAPFDHPQQDTLADTLEEYGKLEKLLLWFPTEIESTSDVLLSRFEMLFSAVHQAGNKTLLFFNDFHRFVGGETQPSAIDLASLLVPALARQEIQLLGTTTLVQYRHHIERFAAIECRVQGVMLLSDEEFQRRKGA
jgi:ATP-dependent Clp protease ATP-binding subunit ClpC